MAIPAQPCLTIPEDDGHLETQASLSKPSENVLPGHCSGNQTVSTAAPGCHGKVSQWPLA